MDLTQFQEELCKIFHTAIQEGNLSIAIKVKELEAKYFMAPKKDQDLRDLLERMKKLSKEELLLLSNELGCANDN